MFGRGRRGRPMTSSRLKLRALGLVVALVLSVVALGSGAFVGTAAAANTPNAPACSDVSYAGTGAGNAPYEVGSAHELQCIGQESTGTSLSDNYELVDDIDASGTSEWSAGDGRRRWDRRDGGHRWYGDPRPQYPGA